MCGLNCLFVFVLQFYGLVNLMGSYQTAPVYPTTSLLGRLSPLSLTSIVYILLPEWTYLCSGLSSHFILIFDANTATDLNVYIEIDFKISEINRSMSQCTEKAGSQS